MISLDEARERLARAASPLRSETVGIAECGDRILAADVTAAHDQPPLPLSAMDGFAVRAADAVAGAPLRLIGDAFAGRPFDGTIGAGEAVRIATGGVLPAGADAILIQENATRSAGTVVVDVPPAHGAWIRGRGIDFTAGQILATTGQRITPARHALIAAANIGTVDVYTHPSVAIIPTGDELLSPGSPLAKGQAVDSASYAIASLVRRWGGAAHRQSILSDDRKAVRGRLEAALSSSDLIVTIGGASVGDRDLLRPVVQELGGAFLFERIAMQPGKPSWCAVTSTGTLILGLPGNVVSAFVCAHLLLQPVLAGLGGSTEITLPTLSARLTNTLGEAGARESFIRACAAVNADGQVIVAAEPRLDSSLLMPLAQANALIRRAPHSKSAEVGERVEVIMLEGVAFAG